MDFGSRLVECYFGCHDNLAGFGFGSFMGSLGNEISLCPLIALIFINFGKPIGVMNTEIQNRVSRDNFAGKMLF